MSFGQFNTEMRESERKASENFGPANHPPSSAMDQLAK